MGLNSLVVELWGTDKIKYEDPQTVALAVYLNLPRKLGGARVLVGRDIFCTFVADFEII